MKLKGHQRRSKWHSPTFTLSGISREELSLILSHAKEGMEAEIIKYEEEEKTDGVMYQSTKARYEKVCKMLEYIDHEDGGVIHFTALELD